MIYSRHRQSQSKKTGLSILAAYLLRLVHIGDLSSMMSILATCLMQLVYISHHFSISVSIRLSATCHRLELLQMREVQLLILTECTHIYTNTHINHAHKHTHTITLTAQTQHTHTACANTYNAQHIGIIVHSP